MGNKKRFYIFLIGFVVLLLLSYQFAISKTILLGKEYRLSQRNKKISENVSRQMQLLHVKEAYYDSILNQFNLTSNSFENNLLKIVNDQSQVLDIRVKEFNAPHLFANENTEFFTYSFTLEGNFVSLLRLLYTIEKSRAYGEIIHLEFKKQQNIKNKKKSLTVRVFIQIIN